MHTEHLQNVSVTRVVAGWLVAAAVASLVALVLLGVGVLDDDTTSTNTWWSTVAIAIGFFAGGFFAGFRALQAPVLHAAGIGLTSLVAWVLVNALSTLVSAGGWTWPVISPEFAVGLLLLQLIATVLGSLIGYNVAVRGRPGLGEHEPL
jgi:peptidoglycan/LPS O-acetylase OafA/YrhL